MYVAQWSWEGTGQLTGVGIPVCGSRDQMHVQELEDNCLSQPAGLVSISCGLAVSSVLRPRGRSQLCAVMPILLLIFVKNRMLMDCFSILEGTVDIQERIENSLASLLELLKGKF